jgi:hypothetical protein
MRGTASDLKSGLKAQTFLGKYLDPLPIRSRGAFQLLSAKRIADGRPCVLVLPGANAKPAAIRAALEEVQRVHALIDHPLIPKVTALSVVQGTPCLELDCDATLDAEDMLRLVADSGQKAPYVGGDGFIVSLRQALQAAHATTDPLTGARLHLGRISLRNVLLSPEGKWYLVGFGRNFPIERENGAVDGETIFFAAPELSTGGAPSPMGDYVALLLFMRSFMPYVEHVDAIGRILRGDLRLTDAELFKLLTWIELRVFAAPAMLRAGMDEAIDAAERIRAILGHEPAPRAFEEYLAAIIRRGDAPAPLEGVAGEGTPRTLWLGPNADWIAGPDGVRHRPGRSTTRLVQELVARHQRRAAALSVQELLEVGWPGERPIAPAGANRVYVELNRLRRVGLRDLLERTPKGYRLAPDTVVQLSGTSRQ